MSGFKIGDRVQVLVDKHAGCVGTVMQTYESNCVEVDLGMSRLIYKVSELAYANEWQAGVERGGDGRASVRVTALREAEQVITKDRQDQYGDAEDCFGDIAALWTTYKRVTFTAHDVAVMMALLKVARIKANPQHNDSYVDGAAYLALAAEMIQ